MPRVFTLRFGQLRASRRDLSLLHGHHFTESTRPSRVRKTSPNLTENSLDPVNPTKMSFQDAKKGGQGDAPKIHKIRITLTSKKVTALEKVCGELIERAKSKELRVKGPVRLPTKNLKISTRKTPCGEGSKTWDMFEMRIHKRLIDLNAPTEVVKQIIINIEAGVEVEVTIAA
ncbi:unnamed protein product [Zymoseptoria tritici ST99CH_3D1]|nr:unnamed protein product [Zymoseptoria tritici ST99CH_3D7]SMR63701.1 unnamed protein product [Zymoseptoria tritici ST99CH_3D1]